MTSQLPAASIWIRLEKRFIDQQNGSKNSKPKGNGEALLLTPHGMPPAWREEQEVTRKKSDRHGLLENMSHVKWVDLFCDWGENIY